MKQVEHIIILQLFLFYVNLRKKTTPARRSEISDLDNLAGGCPGRAVAGGRRRLSPPGRAIFDI